MEVETELLGHRLQDPVVADHQGDFAVELAGAVAQQEVVEAVLEPRDEDRHSFAPLGVGQPPAHVETLGDLVDGALEGGPIGVHLGAVEADALEELAGYGIAVLVGVEDVGAVTVEHLGQRCDQPPTIRAGDQQDGGRGFWLGGHRSSSATARV